MRRTLILLVLFAFAGTLLISSNTAEARFWQNKSRQSSSTKKPDAAEAKKPKLKPFGEVSKGLTKVPGLFDFY
ncbi:MAG: hypothetical protein WBP29_06500, partial [Candidatus Zixiibacteriota bacterium]